MDRVQPLPPSGESASDAAPAVDRGVLHAAVADRLRDLIVEGVLAPGARLNERVLSAQLGVSRTPLREAFKVLAGEGLVALPPNRGAQVAELDRDDVAHAFELIAALERLSGELAAQRATQAEIDEVRALHYEMLAAHARRDLPAYYRANLAIHRLIAAAARNPVLAETYRNVNARIQSLRFKSNLVRDKWDRAVQEHGEMVEALAARDGARLGAVLRRHLENKRDVVLAQLDAARAVPAPRATANPTSARRARPAGAAT